MDKKPRLPLRSAGPSLSKLQKALRKEGVQQIAAAALKRPASKGTGDEVKQTA